MPKVMQHAGELLRRLTRRRRDRSEAALLEALGAIAREPCGDPECGKVHPVRRKR